VRHDSLAYLYKAGEISSFMNSKNDLSPTKRANNTLPQHLGKFDTLLEGLEYAARGETGFNFYSPRGVLQYVVPYKELMKRAVETATKFNSMNLQRGDRVAIVAETSPDFMAAFFACQYVGLIPCPMPCSMNIGGKEAYIMRLKGMMESAHVKVALTPEHTFDVVAEACQRGDVEQCLTFSQLDEFPQSIKAFQPFAPDEVAYIQYSSGSTSRPKGVLITQKSIVANVRGILRHGLQLTPEDRAFSWLPLYHDMGLVGFCLAPMMGQVSVDYLATSAFARRPLLWLKIMSDNGSTISYSPTFGYDLVCRRVKDAAGDFDLSGWRIAGIGGDMVRADVLDAFSQTFAKSCFNAQAFLPSYGMAEATLAVTFAALDEPVFVDHVDRAHCKISRRAVPALKDNSADPQNVRSFVASGRVLEGHELEIRGDAGDILTEREIGHVFIKGPSLMGGYYNNDVATCEVFHSNGWMATGDMGYMVDEQLVITGRSKDLILHNGRNIWPQDIEWAVERLEGLRTGDAAAFALDKEGGDEQIAVLVQCRLGDEGQREEFRRSVSSVVHQHSGVECEVVLVPPRSLPFTSSGKLSRAGAKALLISGEIFAGVSSTIASAARMRTGGLAEGAAAEAAE